MTLYLFNRKAEKQQIALVFADGVPGGDRIENKSRVVLFQLFAFYAEIYYRPDLNEINQTRYFSNSLQIEHYLKDIDISFLFK